MSDRMKYSGRNAYRYAKKQMAKKRSRMWGSGQTKRKEPYDDFQKRSVESC